MRDKPGYVRLTIYVPRQHYDRLVRRKLLLGQSISQSVEAALERATAATTGVSKCPSSEQRA